MTIASFAATRRPVGDDRHGPSDVTPVASHPSLQSPAFLLLAVLVGFAGGCLLGAQPSINGTLGTNLRHPLQAALISFGSGTAVLVVITVATGVFPPSFTSPLSQLPWWIWAGGSIGVVLVTTSLIFVPRIGSLPWFAAVMTGQTVAAIFLDHYGLLGNPKTTTSPLRLVGALLLIAGVLAIVQAKRSERGPLEPEKPSIKTRQ